MKIDEEWVTVAMSDDSLVVDVLLRLHHQPHHPLPLPRSSHDWALRLDWTVRQPRSKSALKQIDAVNKKDDVGDGTRRSPTTPLSWSGATSATGDGFEESSRFDCPRSKVAVASENVSTSTTAKRSRKKKTLAELREEESLLLKERQSLKTELATLRFTVEKHMDTNESLKRMKLDLQTMQTSRATSNVASEETISDQPRETEAASAFIRSKFMVDVACSNVPYLQNMLPSDKSTEVESREAPCLLPDLNLPVEEEPGSHVLCGMR